MKRKKIELDVDYIGGQDPMTPDEEKAISEFIKNQKLLNTKQQGRSTKSSNRKKINA